jgi:hypothetical protein
MEDYGCRESLDYIFECYFNEGRDNTNKKLIINCESLRIEKFLKSDESRVYKQLSDHYGLSCELMYRGNELLN